MATILEILDENILKDIDLEQINKIQHILKSKEGETMIIEYGEYKGNKMITFKKDIDDRYPFSFGLAKAKTILSNLDAIQKFVNDNGNGTPIPTNANVGSSTNEDMPF